MGLNVKYLPVDYKARSEETIVCNLNNIEFPHAQLENYNVVAFLALGSLEYVIHRWALVASLAMYPNAVTIIHYQFGKGRSAKDFAWVSPLLPEHFSVLVAPFNGAFYPDALAELHVSKNLPSYGAIVFNNTIARLHPTLFNRGHAYIDYTPNSVLITGGCGFIASHVVLQLCKKYPQLKVVVLDKMDYCASVRNIQEALALGNCKFVKGDIQSMDLLTFVLAAEKIDTVMHFAAQTHVDNSFGNSLAFTMNNTYGTHVLLEAARKAGSIRRFINVSTDEVYGETSLGKDEGLQEHAMLDPTNPYSAAKAGAEMMCKAYMTSYKMPIIITRGNNVYGPHQFPEKLIP
ncbi:GDP-L-fucose synthase, partial [Raphidocelis subcapitata]